MGTLQIKPSNELQMREWFAAHLKEFDYSIIKSQHSFPDYMLEDGEGRFIAAEAEFASENFIKHGHSPSSCDIVVCWIHTANLPLPVLELSTRTLHDPGQGAVDLPPLSQEAEKEGPTLRDYAEQCPDELGRFERALVEDVTTYYRWLRIMDKPRLELFAAQAELENAIREKGGQDVLREVGKVHPWDLSHYLSD